MPTINTIASPPLPGGMPSQDTKLRSRAVFTNAYALMPHDSMRDIVASLLPHWEHTRAWVLARPMSGFSETFSHYIMEVSPGGGSDMPETDSSSQSVIYVTHGSLVLTLEKDSHAMEAGGYAYIPEGVDWELKVEDETAVFHWIRKRYVHVEFMRMPSPLVTSQRLIEPTMMENSNGLWATTRFVDPQDVTHDMHVNIVTLQPGGCIPFAEMHVMEHGLFVLEGSGDYLLNTDWINVAAGDFMWLRAFCPQACRVTGDGPFSYLLYKDVNRHMPLAPVASGHPGG